MGFPNSMYYLKFPYYQVLARLSTREKGKTSRWKALNGYYPIDDQRLTTKCQFNTAAIRVTGTVSRIVYVATEDGNNQEIKMHPLEEKACDELLEHPLLRTPPPEPERPRPPRVRKPRVFKVVRISVLFKITQRKISTYIFLPT